MKENLGCLIKGHKAIYGRWDSYRLLHTGLCFNCRRPLVMLLVPEGWVEDLEVINGK